MFIPLQADPLPLRDPGDGTLRVGSSRVLLELVLYAFQDGDAPETIASSYETLELPDVYAVLAHYLRHRDEFDAYLKAREVEALALRARLEAEGNGRELRARLRARLGRSEGQDASVARG